MNIQNLRNAIEIEKQGSISKAARALYIAQPNLSKSLRELEEEYHLTIFERTTRGIRITQNGQRFLEQAKEIIRQVDMLEERHSNHMVVKADFQVAIPRASYISDAFTQYVNTLDKGTRLSVHIKETSSMMAISSILDHQYSLGVVRFQESSEKYYKSLFQLRSLTYEEILHYEYLLLVSESSPLTKLEKITEEDLKSCIELIHGDKTLPTGEYVESDVPEDEDYESRNHIYLYERGSQFDLLNAVPTTYIWVSPMPKVILERYHLVQIPCSFSNKHMTDVIVYKNRHRLTREEKRFIALVKKNAETVKAQVPLDI